MNMRNITMGLILSVSIIATLEAQNRNQDIPDYLNTTRTFEQRAADIVSRLTLEEKISQMQYEAPAISRLGIPQYNWWNECLHGVARNGVATVFPQAIGMAATWNDDLIREEADVIATEARSKYYQAIHNNQRDIYQGLTFWSPNINIVRDPRWGRGQETYGEDPYLTSRIGVAFVKGLQGNDARYLKVISTPKHYAVHSGPGLLCHTFDARTSKRDLYETYLPAFEACVKEGGAWSVMGAYNRYMGEACCASTLLLKEILRGKWGFKGYVVSDCGAIEDMYLRHKIVPDAASASALAVKAGCDLTCGREYGALQEAVQKGLIIEDDIDRAVTRLFVARMKLGLFDPPEMVSYSTIPLSANATEENRKLSKRVALESVVLLKNQNFLLPLAKDNIHAIAVIGPNAADTIALLGNYNGMPSHAVSVLEGIRTKMKTAGKVYYARGCDIFNTQPKSVVISPLFFEGGLHGEYFNTMTLEGNPVLVRTDPAVDFNWGAGSPAPGVSKDNFSIRWTGKIVPDTTADYEFTVTGDDGFRLYINDRLMIDDWSGRSGTVQSEKIHMNRGDKYDVKLEYYENSGDASITLGWNFPGALNANLKERENEVRKDFENAKAIASKSDAIVFVGGISPAVEGEALKISVPGFLGGDRTSLDLPEIQEKLLKELQKTGKPIILILMNGSALSINWEQENIPSIVETWYAGQECGNAVADVVFGDYNPAGRLPITFYQSVDDLPLFEDYMMEGRTYRYFKGEPLYPFGYGLSYTKFEYSEITTSKDSIGSNDLVTASVDVKNIGCCDGDEVVQLYVRQPHSAKPQPIKSLRGFKRIFIKKGESRTIQFSLKTDDLKYFDEQKNDFVVDPQKYEIQIGSSSHDIRAAVSLNVIR